MSLWAKSLIGHYCNKDGKYWRINEDLYNGYICEDWDIGDTVTGELLLPHYSKPTTLVKSGSSITAATVGDEKTGFFLKRYNYRNFWHTFKRMFQYPKVFHCLAAALYLREKGIDTPEVLGALVYLRNRFWPGQSFLITKQLPHDCRTLDWVADKRKEFDNFQDVVDGIIDLLVKMHDNKFMHGDLSLRNIYCHYDNEGKVHGFGVIDLDGSRVNRFCKTSLKERTYELARVISSYCRCVKRRSKNKPQLREVLAVFQQSYEKKSNLKLDGELLFSRASYLATRKRRKHN